MPLADVPRIGLGTYGYDDTEQCVESVRTALDVGYRHVDTAQVYGTEEAIRDGIERAGVPREELFLATKLHEDPPEPGFEDVRAGAKQRLEWLGVDYLDLLYVHWPIGEYDAEATLGEFDALREEGVVDHVGVSNFSVDLLDEALDVLGGALDAHQVEMHPFRTQDRLLDHAQEHDYWLVAYSPLAKGEVFDSPVLVDVAERHDVSPAQVSLAWLLAKDNVAVIPKATSEEHLRANRAALDLELDPADVERIDNLDREERYVDRPGAPWNQS